MKRPEITAQDIQVALATLFDYRQNIVIPNVSWGIGLKHEADLVAVSKAGFLKEIEIKVSAQDIKADTKKGPRYARGTNYYPEAMGYHFHMEGPVRQLYFAVPEALANNPNIPERAGLITVSFIPETAYSIHRRKEKSRFVARIERQAKINKNAVPLTEKQVLHLLHLGCMRIWSLKEKLAKQGKIINAEAKK